MPLERAEEARARMLTLVPEGFEERERAGQLELAAYTDGIVGARIARAFGAAQEVEVPEDWADRWRAFHKPVRAGPFWVGPGWEGAPAEATGIVIDPGLAFGTGAHPTTRLCLELLPAVGRRGALLDVGCGSGVLSVAAAKLGFSPVHAVDDDPLAVEITRANAIRNGVAVDARVANAASADLPAADAVVANIALEVVETLAARAGASELVTSGYLAAERPHATGWEHVEKRTLDGWAADRFRRP